MALGAALVWEARAATGNDNNGGAYLAGAGTTDYSQQAAAQLTLTDLATTGVVTTLTSVAGGFTAAMVGNVIQIASGTNFTAGFYQITAFTNTNTITVDRAPTTGVGTGGTGSVGGALATLSKLSGAMVASNKAYVTGAFTSTATVTFSQTVTPSGATAPSRLIGYSSVRGDSGHATLTLSTNTGLTGINCTGFGWWVEQIDVDCGSLGTSTGIAVAAYGHVLNCKSSNFTTRGIAANSSSNNLVADCEATGGGSAATAAIDISGGESFCLRCFVHDNACVGIRSNAIGCTIERNLVVNNSGASSDGVATSFANAVLHNTIHNNGRDGIRWTSASPMSRPIRGNILSQNGAYGMNSNSTLPADFQYDGNAYYSNTSGARNGLDSTAGIFGVTPYTNTRDVTLSASPYVGPTTGTTSNFALNGVAGGGAACKAAGTPGTWPGNTGTTGYLDMGAVQHQDSGGPIGSGRLTGGLQ